MNSRLILIALCLTTLSVPTSRASGDMCENLGAVGGALGTVVVPRPGQEDVGGGVGTGGCVGSATCAHVIVLCAKAIAVATVPCGKVGPAKQCTAVATGGVYAFTPMGLDGSAQFETTYSGLAGAESFKGTLSGGCSWSAASGNDCDAMETSDSYTDLGVLNVRASVKVATAASAKASYLGVAIAHAATGDSSVATGTL